jgi:dihydroorotate dehydrogenase electron transfer subunit
MKTPLSKSERQVLCEVVENVDLAPETPGHFRLTVNAPYIAENAASGQFIHILPPSERDLLRRPISIMGVDCDSGNVTVLYRIIGEGTRLISQAMAGDKLDIIGPLGNGFPIIPDRPAVLFGGGVGIPPLAFLSRKLAESRKGQPVRIILGAREPELIICLGDFAEIGLKPDIFVETGLEEAKKLFGSTAQSVHEGLITCAFDELSDAETKSGAVVYACGPIPMLKAVSDKSLNLGLDCYVSLENKLACGLGACLGCSIPVNNDDGDIHYERVCTEGPVFNASRVAFDKM